MAAFAELGMMPEIIQAVEEMDWLLPTDVQGDAIPLILGGGDVLMAAETGSGKTGAFSLPVIQIVYETLKYPGRAGKKGNIGTGLTSKVLLNPFDRGELFAISPDGLLCQCREHRQWQGCRTTHGINEGKCYYEAIVTDEGLCRVGWSTQSSTLELGKDKFGFGFGGTGKKSTNSQFDDYGKPFSKNDVLGCYLDLDSCVVKYSLNGNDLGKAFDVPKSLHGDTFFAAVVIKNAEIKFNFGDTPFKYPPKGGCVGLSKAINLVCSTVSAPKVSASKKNKRTPLALIIEPARELAQQTHDNISQFKKHLPSPGGNLTVLSLSRKLGLAQIDCLRKLTSLTLDGNREVSLLITRELLVMGGESVKEQIKALEQGVDIVIGTPGRLDDLISTGTLDISAVRFFVLDEADGLLGGGYTDMINKVHAKLPQVSSDGRRLQMIVCSATLHNFDIKKMAERLMYFPIWVDLKGQDSVPETVHHVVCNVDPIADSSWQNLKKCVKTDGIHVKDHTGAGMRSPEALSEAVKILKAEYLLVAIDKHDMDQAIIFCRTKLDCDNIESYLKSVGGGAKSIISKYSCVCLHGDRKPFERKENLLMFKNGDVRFLICTDVAARGIDISGIPFVINVTLPDEKQNYVHRIGRVGRADRMGLAISFVATVKEKVWYHSCPSRGKKCHNTQLTDNGGCAIWYDEQQYLKDIQEHLDVTVPIIDSTFDVPVNEFDGKITYGQKKGDGGGAVYQGHLDQLAPSVEELKRLECLAQRKFLTSVLTRSW